MVINLLHHAIQRERKRMSARVRYYPLRSVPAL